MIVYLLTTVNISHQLEQQVEEEERILGAQPVSLDKEGSNTDDSSPMDEVNIEGNVKETALTAQVTLFI